MNSSNRLLTTLHSRWFNRKRRKNKQFLPGTLSFPQLGIDGDIFHARSVIARMILRPTAKMIDEHQAAMENLRPYIALHVRRGDRLVDRHWRKIEVPEFLEKMQDIAPEIRNIFIATDDYSVVSDFRKLRPDLNIVTFCDEDKKGYDNVKFRKSPDQEKELVNILVDIYYLRNADYFIGSSSNVGRFTALLRDKESYSLDGFWHAW